MDLRFWRVQLAGWTAFWVAMTWSRVGRFPLLYMAVSKAAMAVIGLVYTALLLRPLYRRLLRRELSLGRTIAVSALASYLVAALWTATHGLVDLPIERWLLHNNAHLTNFWQIFGGTLYDAFAILSWSVLYIAIKHQQALSAERERALKAEALAHASRADALRYQLNPHFLFNSLNAISTLVVDGRPSDAATMIAGLADLLRRTLDLSAADVPLSDELELVRRYLALEQVRFGDRLRVELTAESEALQTLVPSLILQPLVENAVRHAVEVSEQGARIAISARRTDGRLILIVEDDGPGLIGADGGRVGVGLANTRERLALKYGDRQRMSLERGAMGGLRVRIDLPADV
jgi:hypothetical protein